MLLFDSIIYDSEAMGCLYLVVFPLIIWYLLNHECSAAKLEVVHCEMPYASDFSKLHKDNGYEICYTTCSHPFLSSYVYKMAMDGSVFVTLFIICAV